MSEYQPGTVAEIRWAMTSGAERAMFDGKHWRTESGVAVFTPTEVRPLVVLDLKEFKRGPYNFPTFLRELAKRDPWGPFPLAGAPQRDLALWIADQIEAQTKPPRIPEPGKYGVVKASLSGDSKSEWVNEGKHWVGLDHTIVALWSDLIDPVLVREGVE